MQTLREILRLAHAGPALAMRPGPSSTKVDSQAELVRFADNEPTAGVSE